MASSIVFCPRTELSGSENLRGFIESARVDLQVFGADLNFHENVWDVTDYLNLKGRGNQRVRINFYCFEDDDAGQRPLPEPFLSFAKAYIRYMHGLRPKKFIAARLCALRAIGQALAADLGASSIEQVNGHVFDSAARILAARYDEALAYRLGGELELLASFVTDNGFTSVPVPWRNTIRRPTDTQRVGPEFDQRRAAKMPSKAALEALPEIFRRAEDSLSIMTTSVAAILLGAPGRINEVLLLPVDCEVAHGDGQDQQLYLRWWTSKGAPPMLKPIVSGMSDAVRAGIAKLRSLSAPAREIAKWYEEHPDQIYLPKGTEDLRTRQFLRFRGVAQIIGVEEGSTWCRQWKLQPQQVGDQLGVLFRDLERLMLSLLPPGFPLSAEKMGFATAKR